MNDEEVIYLNDESNHIIITCVNNAKRLEGSPPGEISGSFLLVLQPATLQRYITPITNLSACYKRFAH
jgi:hypothetical protein